MKESKLLKCISYLLVPILVAMIGISMLSNYVQNNENVYSNESEYFRTDGFVSRYMNILSNFADRLIYQNDTLPTCYDGEIQICYLDNKRYGNVEFENCYVLILYQNKAITNVELTSNTDTIEKILTYIAQNQDSKKVNILQGNIESNSDIISNKGIKYFDYFEKTYYTIEMPDEMKMIMQESEAMDYLEETEEIAEVETQKRQYVTTKIQDFSVYSSYQEKIQENLDEQIIRGFLSHYEAWGENIYVILPVCSTLLFLIFVYLIISVGHTKGKEGIDLNDLDKIPLEVIVLFLCVGFCIVGCGLGAFDMLMGISEDFELLISLLIMSYVISYIICAILFDTIVKRIKAKTLMKNTLCYKGCQWCFGIVKKTKCKIKETWEQMTESMDIVKKLVLVSAGYVVVAIVLVAIFQEFGILLDLGLAIYIFYKIIERINCCTRIETHLRKMYKGDNTAKLNPEEFTKEFQKTVEYINDISNGFENAIQEGIKSERLKTELITNVSHDIKTPLTSIINYVDLLKKEQIENEKVKEYIQILENKSQRLKKLMEDLLEASKASSGNVKLNMEKINVGELIKQSTGEFEDKFKAKNLEVMYTIPEEAVWIKADNRYMYRIIENIFSNVSKYSMEHSRVYVDVEKRNQKVYIAVKNISEDVLNISEEELMQRFVRGDKSRTTEGSGLGISISKSLAELQKGSLALKIDGDLFKVELIFDTIE